VSRAGSRVLSLFTHALNARVLRAYADGPLRLGELEATLGWAPQSSLRVALADLKELRLVIQLEDQGAGRPAKLTVAGQDMLVVLDALEDWLAEGPDGPISLDDAASTGVVRILTAGWDSAIVRALAERPCTLTDLNARIPELSYPALKRRLAKLRATQLVIPARTTSGSMYAASDWLRHAIAPLTVAVRWERAHHPHPAPLTPVEVEAAFLLSLPLSELPAKSSGTCVLAVVTSDTSEAPPEAAGVSLDVVEGRIAAMRAGTHGDPSAWVLGTPEAWFEALVDGSRSALRPSGAKPRLAKSIVIAIQAALWPEAHGGRSAASGSLRH